MASGIGGAIGSMIGGGITGGVGPAIGAALPSIADTAKVLVENMPAGDITASGKAED